MKTTTYGVIGLATAFLIGACVMFQDRIARVTSPELAAIGIETGCTGGREFVEAAVAGLDPIVADIIIEGVKTACALSAGRGTISATIYTDPLVAFCAETEALKEGDTTTETRMAFNQRRASICEGPL